MLRAVRQELFWEILKNWGKFLGRINGEKFWKKFGKHFLGKRVWAGCFLNKLGRFAILCVKLGEMLAIFLQEFWGPSHLGNFVGVENFGSHFTLAIFDVKQGKMLPIVLRELLGGRFSLAISDEKQGEMLPIFPRQNFRSFRFSNVWCQTGQSAANFSARFVLAVSPLHFPMSTRTKCCSSFWQNYCGRLTFASFGVKQGRILPIFLRQFFVAVSPAQF